MSDIHELKADPTPFEDVYSGRKTAEVRRDDRGYKVGDYLQIRETTADRMAYTGRQLGRRITHIQRGYGLPDGVVVLSLESRPTPEQSGEAQAESDTRDGDKRLIALLTEAFGTRHQAIDDLAALILRANASRRDVARYRWLRDSERGLLLCRCDDGSLRYALTDGPAPMNWYATPDAAIDAAMDRSALGREE